MEYLKTNKRYNVWLTASYVLSAVVLACFWAVVSSGEENFPYVFMLGQTGIILAGGFIFSLYFLNKSFSWLRATHLLGLLVIYWSFYGWLIPGIYRASRSYAQGSLVLLFVPVQINAIVIAVYLVIAFLSLLLTWCYRCLWERKRNDVEQLKE